VALAGVIAVIVLLAVPVAAAPDAPRVTVTPASAVGGTTLTLAGSGFAPGQPMAVKCDDKTMATTPPVIVSDASGAFSATAAAPTGQPGPHELQVSDGTKTTAASFETTLTANISKTTTEAAPGTVGMELTVTGNGFSSGAKISVTADSDGESELATIGADEAGNFEVTFTVPPIEGGAHAIKVTDGTNTSEFSFVMESKAPAVPVTVGPKPGTKADQPVRFEWKAVTDPSGVTYSLEVATSADFADLVLEKTGLTGLRYEAAGDESLKPVIKETPYYWRVQAIDGAGNRSEWSAPAAFHLGFVLTLPNGEAALTMSAVLVYVAAVIAIGLLVLSFWLGRRSARRHAPSR